MAESSALEGGMNLSDFEAAPVSSIPHRSAPSKATSLAPSFTFGRCRRFLTPMPLLPVEFILGNLWVECAYLE